MRDAYSHEENERFVDSVQAKFDRCLGRTSALIEMRSEFPHWPEEMTDAVFDKCWRFIVEKGH